MAEPKTRKTKASVEAYVRGIADPDRRRDVRTVMKMMKSVTGKQPTMWGPSIVGYGSYHYKYASGREGDWFVTGFSSRKQALTLYLMAGFEGCKGLLAKLGKYKTGKSCLYIKRLSDIDTAVLQQLIQDSADRMTKRND